MAIGINTPAALQGHNLAPVVLSPVGGGDDVTLNVATIFQVTDETTFRSVYYCPDNHTQAVINVSETISDLMEVLPLVELPLVSPSTTIYTTASNILSIRPIGVSRSLVQLGSASLPMSSSSMAPAQATVAATPSVIAAAIVASLAVTEDVIASIAATGLVQGGGAIPAGTTLAVITSASLGNTATTLPAAIAGRKLRHIDRSGFGSPLRVFPALGDAIYPEVANAFIWLSANDSLDLVCPADGTWVDASTQINHLITQTIEPPLAGGSVTIRNGAAGSAFATFSALQLAMSVPVQFDTELATALAGGGSVGAPVYSSNHIVADTVATDYDSIMLGTTANVVIVENPTGRILAIYPPVGGTIDGIAYADGYPLCSGNVAMFVRTADGGADLRSSLLATYPCELTAFAGGGQVGATILNSPSATATVVATEGDSFVLIQSVPSVTLAVPVGLGGRPAVYAPVGETIDGVTDGFVTLDLGGVYTFTRTSPGNWQVSVSPRTLNTQYTTAAVGAAVRSNNPVIIVGTANANPDDNVFLGNDAADSADYYLGGTVVNPTATAVVLNSVFGVGKTFVEVATGAATPTYTLAANSTAFVYREGLTVDGNLYVSVV